MVAAPCAAAGGGSGGGAEADAGAGCVAGEAEGAGSLHKGGGGAGGGASGATAGLRLAPTSPDSCVAPARTTSEAEPWPAGNGQKNHWPSQYSRVVRAQSLPPSTRTLPSAPWPSSSVATSNGLSVSRSVVPCTGCTDASSDATAPCTQATSLGQPNSWTRRSRASLVGPWLLRLAPDR